MIKSWAWSSAFPNLWLKTMRLLRCCQWGLWLAQFTLNWRIITLRLSLSFSNRWWHSVAAIQLHYPHNYRFPKLSSIWDTVPISPFLPFSLPWCLSHCSSGRSVNSATMTTRQGLPVSHPLPALGPHCWLFPFGGWMPCTSTLCSPI